MKVLVYGAGAMGSSLGMRLPAPCDLVTRNPAQREWLKSRGCRVLAPEEMKGRYDAIFLATKQRENPAIARFLLPFLEEDGALATVQNGLPEEGLARIFGADRVYGCVLGWGAEMSEEGGRRTLVLTSEEEPPRLALGAFGKGDKLGALEALLSPSFAVTVGDLKELRYAKLAVNASFSTLSAISSLSFGELARRHKKLVLSLMRETVAVARAEGCERLVQNGHDIMKLFSSPFAGLLLPFAMRKHKRICSGMLKDLRAGRRCDIDFVAGAVVSAGKARGVPTPCLERAVRLVHEIENGLAELAPESLGLLSSMS